MDDPKDERDEALLARFAKHGDRTAAGVLVERHQRAAYDLAFRILRVEADAADATQSAFLNLLQAAARFREGAAFRTWLYRIVVNEALKLRAARERRSTVEKPIDESFAAASPDRERLLSALDREVDALEDAHRLPILLHYYRGLGYDEAATVLGCAPGTVGSRLAAARDKLRARLAALGVVVALPDLESSLRAMPATEPPAALHASLTALAATSVAKSAALAWMPWAAGGAAVAAGVVVVAMSSGPRAAPPIAATAFSPQQRERLQELGYLGSNSATSESPKALAYTSSPPQEKPAASAGETHLVVSGVVFDRATGLPLEGVTVALEQVWPITITQQKEMFPDRNRTDASGQYHAESHAPGPAIFRLHVWPGTDKTSAAEDAVIDASGERTEKIDFSVVTTTEDEYERLQNAPERKLVAALREVIVRDRVPAIVGTIARADGRPLQHRPWPRLLDSTGQEDWQHQFAVDLETGEFVFAPVSLPGTCRFEVVATGEGFGVVDPLEIAAGAPTLGVVVTLRGGDAAISGTVVDRDGRPIAGAGVSAMPVDPQHRDRWLDAISQAQTDEAGRFRLEHVGAAGDSLRIVASAPDVQVRRLDDVKAGTADLVISMHPFPRVTGRVLLKATGLPPEDFAVSFEPKLPTKSDRPVQTLAPGITMDPTEGRFWSMDAMGGENTLVISVEGHPALVRTFVVGDEDLDLGDLLVE